MFKKSIRAIAAAAVFCVTAIFSGVTVSADSADLNSRLAQLKWGMTVEEVEAIMGTPDEKEEDVASGGGQMQTLLTYNDVDFRGSNSYIILCYTEENGFEGVNFHIPTDNSSGLYAELFGQLKQECTEYENDGADDIISLFHYDNDNTTVYMFDFFYEVQVSYFPLFEEGCRVNPQKGGNEAAAVVHEPSPETGNAGAAVYACAAALAGTVAVLARKKRAA